MSAFLDSDDCFPLYRRFGYLQSRILLQKQDELRDLEDLLLQMDQRDDLTEDGRECLQSRDLDESREDEPPGETRKELLSRIEKKLLEYGMLRRLILCPLFSAFARIAYH